MPDAGPGPESRWTLAALRNPQLRGYCAARTFSTLSHSLLGTTLAWHAYDLTASSFALGLLGLVQFLPVVPVSLVGGAIADSRDRRSLVALSQTAACLVAVGLGVAAFHAAATLPLLLAAAFALAVARSFESPSNMALLPTLVSRELFPSAVVVSAMARNIGWVSGPMAMGIAVHRAGIPAAYAAATGCFVVSIFLVSRLRPVQPAEARRAVSLAAIREGIGFVRSRPVILGSMSLDMFAVIFASSTALLPIYARAILQVDELHYSRLAAALPIGTTLMTLILLARRPPVRPGRALLFAVAVFGLATVGFGLSRSFPLSMAALVVAGMADEVSMISRMTIIQLSTPDALRGRVSSVNMVFIGASNELGAAESGFLAALTSATVSVVFGGLACLAVLGIVTARVPALRHYRVDTPAAEPG